MPLHEVIRGPGHLRRLLIDVAHRSRVVITHGFLTAASLCSALPARRQTLHAAQLHGRLTSLVRSEGQPVLGDSQIDGLWLDRALFAAVQLDIWCFAVLLSAVFG